VTKSRGIRTPRRAWSEFEDAVMRLHYPNTFTRDLAELFNRTEKAVHARAKTMGVRKSLEFLSGPMGHQLDGHRGSGTRFRKGNVPWCAGMKGVVGVHENCRRTQFKKGEMGPRNRAMYIPIGGTRINADGYLDRKVRDDGPPQDRFERVHRLVWMEAHGPIPENHVVVFKTGKPITVLEEITLDRLECISRGELALRNQCPPELKRIVQLRGAITRQINKRLKEQAS